MERSRSSIGLGRFYYVAATSFIYVPCMVLRYKHYMKHPEKYDRVKKFKFVKEILRHLQRRGRVRTEYFGRENLPKDGGYVLYSNHQGKYDAIGILIDQKEPCGVMMEKKQGNRIAAKQVVNLSGGLHLDLDNPREQLKTFKELTEKLEAGDRILIFPEGKWGDNKNTLLPFNAGCFRSSMDSKTPIVPVTIIDSWKGLNGNSLKKVTTQVHYLEPIMYEEYKDMNRKEVCDLVKSRIQAKIGEVLSKRETE